MAEILTLGVDDIIMWVLYFLESMILANVVFERARVNVKSVILHMAIIVAAVWLAQKCPAGHRVVHLQVFIGIILLDMYFTGSYKKKLWGICITQCIYFITFTLGWVLFDYIGHKLNLEILFLKSIAGIWALGISIIQIKFFKGSFLYYKDKKLYEQVSWKESIFYAVVSIAVILTANIGVVIYKEGITFRGGDVRIALISYTASVGIIIYYLKIRKKATLECEAEERELIRSFATKQLETYKRLERLEKEGKLAEKDMYEQLSQLTGLVDEQQLDYVKPYVEAIQSQLIKEDNYILTGNTIVDAIINEKYKVACEKHIFISINISLPDKLSVDVGDLCLIIGNSIDYVLEACEKITLGKGHKIKIQGIWYKGYVIFRIWYSKPRNMELDEKLSSEEETRAVIENDMYGIGAVEKCLKKYDGKLEVYTEGRWQKVEFYFNTAN